MFIRRNKNRSGSYSIQIIQKVGRRNRVIKTLGSSSNSEELERLERLASQEIRRLEKQKPLFQSGTDELVKRTLASISNQQVRVIGPDLILGKIFSRVGYDQIEDDAYFRHLVIARIMSPGSKLRTSDYLWRYHSIELPVDRIYRYMDKLQNKYKEPLQRLTFEYSKRTLGQQLNVVFYDMTTLYFEASEEDDLRRTGFSKDGKAQHPQIKLGFLVGQDGFPLGYDIFQGNTFEGETMLPVLAQIEAKFNLGKPVVVADAGLLSRQNMEGLEQAGYPFILGGRVRSESEAMKQKIQKATIPEGKPTEFKKGNYRLIVSYSSQRAKKDAHNRKRGLSRLENKIKSKNLTKKNLNNRGYNKYLVLKGKATIEIDYEKFKMDEQWDGLKSYMTNTKLSRNQVIASYGELWHIEKAFKISKTDLRARPIFHRIERRIEAHITICFAAYAMFKELERALKASKATFSANRAIDLIRNMYQITVQLPESLDWVEIPLRNDDEQQRLIEIFA